MTQSDAVASPTDHAGEPSPGRASLALHEGGGGLAAGIRRRARDVADFLESRADADRSDRTATVLTAGLAAVPAVLLARAVRRLGVFGAVATAAGAYFLHPEIGRQRRSRAMRTAARSLRSLAGSAN